jgi:hypothetical protein
MTDLNNFAGGWTGRGTRAHMVHSRQHAATVQAAALSQEPEMSCFELALAAGPRPARYCLVIACMAPTSGAGQGQLFFWLISRMPSVQVRGCHLDLVLSRA